ncbi:hypothetical protein [Bosea sp. NPDC055594]
MQNASVAIYQSLLPGISNVTLRMRYYGFFCWVSDAYAETGATTEYSAWLSWVRRSEALYALVSARAGGQGGVGGIDWAEKRLSLNEAIIDFSDAVTSDVNTRYLTQTVFAGAYYSQMAEMGLFRLGDHGIQRITKEAGRATAGAFRSAIGRAVEDLLRKSIMSARVARDDLAQLAVIVPSAIEDPSPERDAYEGLLFPSDETTAGDERRAASLRLLLKTAQSIGGRPSPDDFRWHMFSPHELGSEVLDKQRLRWEIYQCQDLFQMAAAGLLSWSIDLMRDAGRPLAEIKEEVRDRLSRANPDKAGLPWSKLRADINTRVFDYRGSARTLTRRSGTTEDKAWDAVLLVAALDQRLIDRPDLLDASLRELKFRGSGRSILTERAWIGPRSEEQTADLIASFVVERIVERHTWVAIQKLRRQHDYTFLFEVHDGRWIRRKSYEPVATTPRLIPAVQFLVDVGLLGEQGITARGRAVLGAIA